MTRRELAAALLAERFGPLDGRSLEDERHATGFGPTPAQVRDQHIAAYRRRALVRAMATRRVTP